MSTSTNTDLDLTGGGLPSPSSATACLTVVIPCFNEENTVAEAVDRVLDKTSVAEVIIVDDASSDSSWKVISQLSDPRIRLARHSFNLGKGAAIALGISMATSPFTVIQDADLEYNPDEYDLLLEPLLSNRADVVYGSRFHTDRPHRVLYYWHSVGNKLLTIASNMASNINLTDMETCYKMGRTDLMQSLDLREDRFGVEPEMTQKLARRGARIYEVGISYDGRTYEDGKKIGWRDGVRALYCIIKYRFARQPRSDIELRDPNPDHDVTVGEHNFRSELLDLTAPLDDGHQASSALRRFLDRIDLDLDDSTGSLLALELTGNQRHQRMKLSDVASALNAGDRLILVVPTTATSPIDQAEVAIGPTPPSNTLGSLKRLIAQNDLALDEVCHGDPLASLDRLVAGGFRLGPLRRPFTDLAANRRVRGLAVRIGDRLALPMDRCIVCVTSAKPR